MTRLLVAVTAPQSARVLLRGQLSWFREQGYETMAVSSPGPDLEVAAAREGVTRTPLPMRRETSISSDLRSLWRFWRLIRSFRPDVTNVSTPKAGLLGGLAAWMGGVPARVYTLRGLRLETTQGLTRTILWMTEWISCRAAHAVVAVSPSLADRVVELNLVRRDKLVIIGRGSSNGVEARRFSPSCSRDAAARELRRRLRIPAGAAVVGFVGRLGVDKGVVELITAFDKVRLRLPGACLLLVGDVEGARDIPARVMGRLANGGGIFITGWMTDPSVAYHTMQILTLPTHREGFPNTALEAAAAGVPVVTTNATGAVDSVIHGRTGLVVQMEDADGLAEAIIYLLSNPEEAKRLGRNARDWVERDFVPETIWQGLDALYCELLARHPRRRLLNMGGISR